MNSYIFFHGNKIEYCEDCKDSLFMGSYCDYSSKLNLALKLVQSFQGR